jgi:RNA polymerase sigma-70 factor (ECF subfamily)
MFLKLRRKTDLSNTSDEYLLTEYSSSGDKRLVGELFSRYTHLLFSVAFSILRDEAEAKDTVMKVFEKMMVHPSDPGIRNYKSWIYTVTRNQCLMDLRHRNAEARALAGKMAELERELSEMEDPESTDPPHTGDNWEARLRDAIGKLNHGQRSCIELFYMEEQSYAEIAEFTGFDLNQVKSHIQNGKRNLKNMLENAGKE